jgi:hypothetical protein
MGLHHLDIISLCKKKKKKAYRVALLEIWKTKVEYEKNSQTLTFFPLKILLVIKKTVKRESSL